MGIKIIDLLDERKNYGIERFNDKLVHYKISLQSNKIAFITIESCFSKMMQRELFNGYYVTAIFDLSSLYSQCPNIHFSMYVLSKKQPKVVKIGQYLSELRNTKSRQDSVRFEAMKELPESYMNYLQCIEKWVNQGITPEDDNNCEFNSIAFEEYDPSQPFAKNYSKKYRNIIEYLTKEKTVRLDTVAEIINPNRVDDERLTLIGTDLVYPFNPEKVKKSKSSDVKVLYDDIILLPGGKIYLFDDINNSDKFYLHPIYKIVRAKSISAKYLYLYLKTETAQIILNTLSHNRVIKLIDTKLLSSIPIVIPQRDVQFFVNTFKSITYGNDDIKKYYNQIDLLNSNNNNLEGVIFDELQRNLLFSKDEAITKFLSNDMAEIKACYKVKAYKAVLILAGSVLEGFLIDWLSEIHKTDYFSSNYYVKDKRNLYKEAVLADYIDAIDAIKKPKWMEAGHAHEIRSKRNLVHAKLCLKQTEEINEKTCKMVIQYLSNIIKTRYNIS